MATTGKSPYPKAMPLHSPEELAAQTGRLNKQSEELAERSGRLDERQEKLDEQSAGLWRWTYRLVVGYALLALIVGGGVFVIVKHPGVIASIVPSGEPISLTNAAPAAQQELPPSTSKTPPVSGTPTGTVKPVPTILPIAAVKAEPGAAEVKPAFANRASFLEALGGLSATHLYQSHLNIGLLADAVESETYSVEDGENNLKSVVELMKMVDGQLAKVSKSGLEPEDQESVRQIQTVNALLRLQVDSLRAYWATGEAEDAQEYHKARKAAWQGLAKVMGFE
ncbi:MAG: hypothetical protein HYR84_12890 [Planctomycetes bacterium]|nr:hypothetical protein [Planctomycetota bacterium]